MFRKSLLLVGLTLGIVLSQGAYAQDPGIISELERTASTTPEEKVQYAATANQEMRDAVKTITKLVEAARRDSNIESLQCLTNRLNSIKALLQVGEAAEGSLGTALSAGEVERANHEFRKIAVARSKSQQLLAEAERCATDSIGVSGEFDIKFSGGLEGDPSDDLEGWVDDMVTVWELSSDPPDGSPYL